MAKTYEDQEFVEFIVKAMVDNPKDVKSDRTVDEMGVLITLHVNPQDLGQVIGRSGQTAKSIRTLLRVVGAKNQARVNLKIHEPEGRERPDGRERSRTPREAASAPASAPTDDAGIDDLKL